jgi:hypothetical protein
LLFFPHSQLGLAGYERIVRLLGTLFRPISLGRTAQASSELAIQPAPKVTIEVYCLRNLTWTQKEHRLLSILS